MGLCVDWLQCGLRNCQQIGRTHDVIIIIMITRDVKQCSTFRTSVLKFESAYIRYSNLGLNCSASAACDECRCSSHNEFVARRPRETSVEAVTLAAS